MDVAFGRMYRQHRKPDGVIWALLHETCSAHLLVYIEVDENETAGYDQRMIVSTISG
jgi:hypothetical protein